jgi:PAS domain S-box-containing protein
VSLAARPAPASSREHEEVEVALIDTAGMIISVNGAWDTFCEENGGDPARLGIGASYLDVCTAAAGDPDADRVADAILRALQGDLPAPLAIEVPCHSPERSRWYDVVIASRYGDDGTCLGATLTVSLAACGDRSQPPVAPTSPWFSERLGDSFAQAIMELAPFGIVVSDDEGLVVRANDLAEEMFGYGRNQLVGRHLHRLFPQLVQTERGRIPEPAGGSPQIEGTHGASLVGRRADGSPLRAQAHLGPVTTSRGTGTVVLVTPVDHAVDASPR